MKDLEIESYNLVLWSMNSKSHCSSEATLLVQIVRAVLTKTCTFLHVSLECFLTQKTCQIMVLAGL